MPVILLSVGPLILGLTGGWPISLAQDKGRATQPASESIEKRLGQIEKEINTFRDQRGLTDEELEYLTKLEEIQQGLTRTAINLAEQKSTFSGQLLTLFSIPLQ